MQQFLKKVLNELKYSEFVLPIAALALLQKHCSQFKELITDQAEVI